LQAQAAAEQHVRFPQQTKHLQNKDIIERNAPWLLQPSRRADPGSSYFPALSVNLIPID
jgi:hypothetical protein